MRSSKQRYQVNRLAALHRRTTTKRAASHSIISLATLQWNAQLDTAVSVCPYITGALQRNVQLDTAVSGPVRTSLTQCALQRNVQLHTAVSKQYSPSHAVHAYFPPHPPITVVVIGTNDGRHRLKVDAKFRNSQCYTYMHEYNHIILQT